MTAGMLPSLGQRETGQGDSEEPARSTPPKEAGLWGIQVGAHSSKENAETQLSQVKKQMRDLLGSARDAIVPLSIQGNVLYRVRFGAFTPNKAERICDQMQGRGVSCLVVTESGWNQSGTSASRPIAVR
jgi:cell division protein FtsN